jgi:hypothetical protein
MTSTTSRLFSDARWTKAKRVNSKRQIANSQWEEKGLASSAEFAAERFRYFL